MKLALGAAVAIVAGLAVTVALVLSHPTVRVEKVIVTTTIAPDRSLPPGITYGELKPQLIDDLKSWWAATSQVGKGFPPWGDISCVLPPIWGAGVTFECTTFDKTTTLEDGTATFLVETPDPGQPYSLTVDWSSSG